MYISNKIKGLKHAFTLIEILIVLALVGMLSLPFTNMFIFGVKGSQDNTEHILAYNLAREKIEEIKCLPFDMVKSDYMNFRDVFQDRQKYDEAYYNEDDFILCFTDVFTILSLKNSDMNTSYTRLKNMYPKSYLKKLTTYPEDYALFRRVTKVEAISDSALPPMIKKVTVLVYENKNKKKIAELSTLIGNHK